MSSYANGPKTVVVDAVLFDMDGTLIDSTPAALKAWENFCTDYSLGDYVAVANAARGRRLHDTLREYGRIDDQVKLQSEIDRFETEVIEGGLITLPGAISLIAQLSSQTTFGWTIVTSATKKYTPRALKQCGVPLPPAGYVTASECIHGKPDPAPYLAGAQMCGVDPTKCLVIEDAIAGLKSGRAAGALTLAVCTSNPRQTILDSNVDPHYIVTDLTKVSARWVDGKIEVTMDESMD